MIKTHVLVIDESATFDKKLTEHAEELLVERGVKVKTNCGIEEIIGDGKVESVKFSDGTVIEADAVILSLGYQPMLTASPAGYPLIKAAEVVAKKLRAK